MPLLGTFATTVPFELNWCWDAKNVTVLAEEQTGRRGACSDCTVFFWSPCPGSRSTQSPENAMHLLLSEVRKCTLSLVVSAQSSPCARLLCCMCMQDASSVYTTTGVQKYLPYPLPLSAPVKRRAPLQRWAQRVLVVSGLFTYKICLCKRFNEMHVPWLVMWCSSKNRLIRMILSRARS